MNKLYTGDSAEVLKKLESNSANISITSPPYKTGDGFSYGLMKNVFDQLFRIQKPDSLFFLNFGHLAEEKLRPFKVASLACDSGYKLNDTFVWVKNHFRPIQGDKRVNNLTEFVFLLFKGQMPKLNRLSIGVPYVDSSNAKRFNGGHNLRCRGNVWEIPYQTINNKSEKLHNDRFPVQLPEFCIKLSDIPKGSLVLEPFLGSGSTCLAAKNLGMEYIGIDKEQHWLDVSSERLSD